MIAYLYNPEKSNVHETKHLREFKESWSGVYLHYARVYVHRSKTPQESISRVGIYNLSSYNSTKTRFF
jgi:hypothetical protein